MEKLLTDLLPIMEVSDGLIVSKMGDVTIAYELTKPEVMTLSGGDYYRFHEAMIKAIKVLPSNTVLHMQDWFTETKYKANIGEGFESFLAEASERFFVGRPYLDHRSYLFLTRKPANRKPASSALSSLLRRSLVPEETLSEMTRQEFLEQAGQFERILSDSGLVRLRRMSDEDIVSHRDKTGIIEQYCYLTGGSAGPEIRDLSLEKGIHVGKLDCQLYTLADAQSLPRRCSSYVSFEPYSTDQTDVNIGLAAWIGPMLSCNHIYNQYIFLEDGPATLKKLESKRLRLQSLANHSRENAIAKDAVDAFLNEAIGEQRSPVKAHFNVFAWTDDLNQVRQIKNEVRSAMAQMEAVPHYETAGAAQIWWAGIPGNAGDFPMNEAMHLFAEHAVCFLNMETNYRSAPRGIRFGDRITGKPVNTDLFDEPMQKGVITNRGMFVCGSSGGGKSMLCNHIFRSLFDEGAHIVVVDIGGSYKNLCEMVGGYYFTYTEADPIRFNPFYLSQGEALDTEKKESLKALLVTLWKQEHESFNRSEYVALSNALQGYYARLATDPALFPCFDTFYEWLESDYVQLLKQHKVKDRDFDIENFLYVLRPYYKGGEFDYLLNASENLDLLKERFIVFELDNIKDHPILLPVVSLIIMELTISKMRKIPSALKAFAIEEAWKPMMQAGMSQFMKYAWKTFRKLNGIPIVVTQEIDDLTSSPIIKEAIIANSDIKVLMDMRKFINKFDGLQAVLGMTQKGKELLFSVNRANEPGRKYREFYLELGGQEMKVLRYEPSPEEYYTYTTEPSEKLKVMEYAAKYGSMQKGIEALVADQNKIK
jgi:conjugation system TraG family ATPase